MVRSGMDPAEMRMSAGLCLPEKCPGRARLLRRRLRSGRPMIIALRRRAVWLAGLFLVLLVPAHARASINGPTIVNGDFHDGLNGWQVKVTGKGSAEVVCTDADGCYLVLTAPSVADGVTVWQ